MTYIEFIGPPGAGKSSLHKKITKKSNIYGGTPEKASERAFLDNSIFDTNIPKHYQILYQFFPTPLKKIFSKKVLRNYLSPFVLTDFMLEHQEFLEVLKDILKKEYYKKERVLQIILKKSENYQLGISTIRENEKLLLDEGFAMGAAIILWLSKTKDFSFQNYFKTIQKYFNAVPIPKTLIYVNCPPKLCIKRQKNRSNVIVEQNWGEMLNLQIKHQKACEKVIKYLKKEKEVQIINIQNEGEIEENKYKLNEVIQNL
ncbi:hypothetical protein [Methanonatronarchaeum sp. AMET-Sl]|uniref:hypothetical protein n=1 Tax=Methanonatronarchaeum sp. AMET-Sl TaxID=3037654 RepID=UPI00244E58AA|nr:hypothetical protein [Methanonatronarchaeum sp. AMET-Sl]WGI17637.1 hypothetical protein QEN48_01105 [Methanonatronarchaeum sp. AMET-Sl]